LGERDCRLSAATIVQQLVAQLRLRRRLDGRRQTMSTPTTALVHPEQRTVDRAFAAAGVAELRRMVFMSVPSEHSKRNYAKALDELFTLCEKRQQPLSRALLMEYRAAMMEKDLSPSTVNVRLSAICSFQEYLAQCFRAIWRNVSELFGVIGVSWCRSKDCPAPLQPLHWI
jgi:hypothetical protein